MSDEKRPELGSKMTSSASTHSIIHSGHFMVSQIHSPSSSSSDEDAEIDVVTSDTEEPKSETKTGSSKVDEEKKMEEKEKPVTFYKFGPKQTKSIAIDVSLGKLNKCLHLAYK